MTKCYTPNALTDKNSTGSKLKPLGKYKFHHEEWNIGDTVRLTNGKTYKVIGLDIMHSKLELRSEEYGKNFRVDCRIIHGKVRTE